MQKGVNGFLDNETAKRLQMGSKFLDKIDEGDEKGYERRNRANKKLKHYKGLLENAQKKQGRDDPILNDKL